MAAVFDPEVYGEPVYSDGLFDTDVYGEELFAESITVSPPAFVVTTSVPAPSIQLDIFITAVPLVVGITVPAPSVLNTLTSVPLVVTTSLPAPSLSGSITAVPLVVTTSIPPPTIVSDIVVTAVPLVVTTSMAAPTLSMALTAAPLVVTFTIPPPTVSGNVSVTAVPLTVTWTIPPPGIAIDQFVTGVPFVGTWTIPTPSLDTVLPATSWSYKIDDVEINDGISFVTQVPEIDNSANFDIVLAQIDGDYPVLVRTQQVESVYTFLIAMTPCNWSTYNTRMSLLRTLFSPGSHTFKVQARGMDMPREVSIIAQTMIVQPKERQISVKTVAHKPVLV